MALTSTYSSISASQTDADSPIDTVLMDGMRQNIDVCYEWIGGPTYTPSTSHDHDGVNSKPVVSVADDAITLPKISLEEFSTLNGSSVSIATTAWTNILTYALTTVTSGDRLLITSVAISDSTDSMMLRVAKTAGTATIQIGASSTALYGSSGNSRTGMPNQQQASGVIQITGSGSLTLGLQGRADVGVIGTNFGQIHIMRFLT